MNKEEIDIWLKHFTDNRIAYLMFDKNGKEIKISFYRVLSYMKELEAKVSQLETNRDEAINHLKNDDNIIDIFLKHDFRKQNDYNPLTGEDYCPVRCVELYGYDELLSLLERGKE